MVKKLTRHGNSLALVIDRPILDLLKIDPETPLEVSTDGRRLVIVPAGPSARRRKFDAAQEWAHKRYGKAFKKLAERPVRGKGPLTKERGVWVFRTGEPLPASATDGMLRRIREERDLTSLGKQE
jgi:antitoxin component of MazEF toxin-antitoxin module